MDKNFDKYKNDLEKLIKTGIELQTHMLYECNPNLKKQFEERGIDNAQYEKLINKLPIFEENYQIWYSEAYICIKQLLPDRLTDFIKQYKKVENRKNITAENYVIEDYLNGINVTRGSEKIVDKYAAIPKFEQQLAILKSAQRRFESSLFEIKQLIQADLFDTEIEAAKELLKKGFLRAAGAVAGVVLEKHLKQVCFNHNIIIKKKNPGIADINELLKANDIIDVPIWRNIQHMADLRNLADHNKNTEPTSIQIDDLINGVDKIIKTLF